MAFSRGIDGVFIGGCRLNECSYTTQGNYHALNMVFFLKKILEHIGLDPERLRIAFMSSSEAHVFVENVNDFVRKVRELGPLGKGEGVDVEKLKRKFTALKKLIPYIRLVISERLRLRFGSVEEYRKFYSSEEFEGLFRELIADKLAVSEIVLLLRENSYSAGEIARILGLNPADVPGYLASSAKQGLVSYDRGQWRYALSS